MEILSDNAASFCNIAVEAVLQRYRISHRKATPHHHEGNAQVERVIQTLQEKLSLITHDPACVTDWKDALPSAILSINSSVHATTGLTPFELIFGRRHALRTSEVMETRSPEQMFSELSEDARERNRAEAVARQSQAQQASAERFNASHRPLSFEVGELVLARTIGRRTKLQNRFTGPYRVTRKNDDIYTIENVEGTRRERLERHISDLKKYLEREGSDEEAAAAEPPQACMSVQSVLTNPAPSVVEQQPPILESTLTMQKHLKVAILLLLLRPCSNLEFKEAPVVSWIPVRATVSERLTELKLGIIFGDPCSVLSQFKAPVIREVDNAIQQCRNIFREQIESKLIQLKVSQAQRPSVVIPAQPAPSHVGNRILQHVVRPVDTTMLHRVKRGLGDVFVGAFASNILERIIDHYWPNPEVRQLEDKAEDLRKHIASLNLRANFTSLELTALSESHSLLQLLVKHNVQKTDAIATVYPQLSIVASNIVSKINLVSALLDRVIASFRAQRPDLQSLYLVFGYMPLLQLDPGSIDPMSVDIRVTDGRMLIVELNGHRRSADTSVYQVLAFRHHTNLLTDPAMREYYGPSYVLYNRTAHCAKGLTPPTGEIVTSLCAKENYVDRDLQKWRVSEHPPETQKAQAWPFVYVYCYPLNITIKNTTSECPPYVFELDASEPFNTTDKRYSIELAEMKIGQSPALNIRAHQIHLQNGSETVSKVDAVKRVQMLLNEIQVLEDQRRNATRQETLIEFRGYRVNYTQTALVLSGFSCVVLAAALIGWQQTNRKWRKRLREMRRAYHAARDAADDKQRRCGDTLRNILRRPSLRPALEYSITEI